MCAAALKLNNGETFYHTSFTPSQNGQNTYFELATGMEAIIPSNVSINNADCLDSGAPYLEIIVEPCDKFRFRYKSESGSHGKLRGLAKNRSKTNFPTIKVHNLYESYDNVQIRASLYTENKMPHILELVGKNCKNGACAEKLSEDNTAIFRFLEIESKRKEEAIDILMKKKNLGGNRCDKEELRKLAIENMKQLNMNCAMLCFEALYDNVPICEKVFSGLIKNLKSTASDLRITRISSSAGSCRGGEDIILLCDKINKDDIEIHFYEKDENNDEILWRGKGIFSPKVDVHHQVAIAFKTPPYKNKAGGTVQMELYRQSDKQSSEPRMYTYIRDDIDSLRHSKKRKFNPLESIELLDINQASSSTASYSNQASSSTVSYSNQASNSSVPDVNQASDSSSSDFTSWSSNTSDVGAIDAFLGSPDVSSIEEDLQFSPSDWKEIYSSLMNNNLNQLFEELPETYINLSTDPNVINPSTDPNVINPSTDPNVINPSTDEDYDHEMKIDAAAFDFDPYETQELTFSPQSAVGNNRTKQKFADNGTITQTSSGGGGIFAILADLAGIGSTNLWNATVGRAASYMTPSPSNNKRDIKTPSPEFATGQMGNPAIRAPRSADNKRFAQSLVFDMNNLSIQEDNKKDLKPFVPLHVNNKKSPVNSFDKTVFTDANSYDIKYTRNVEASEMNKNFDSFKEGVTEIMKRRGKDVYLHYISRLMSVKDENGNLFIHLAVLEQCKNFNLMTRILKIAPSIVNEQNRFKETPLHLAIQKNAFKVAFLLLAEGANPSIMDVNGNNCFHIASKSNYANSMKILLAPSLREGKHIPSIDGFNYDGFAPLHLSVMNNAKECMQLLLKAGADVNINDRISGSSPLHLAIKQRSTLAFDLLCRPDIDLLNTDFKGRTIVLALCLMKGTPMPVIDEATDFVDWARKTLSLPSKDSDESSGTDSSSNSDSEEEVANQHETEATPSFSYSRNVQSYSGNSLYHGINEVEEVLNSVSEECEKRLCKCLDVDDGWRKLGSFVGLNEKTLNGVSKLSKNSSPSKLVLRSVKKLYQKWDKETLINILTAADLKNIAQMLVNERF